MTRLLFVLPGFLSIAACVALFRFKLGMLPTLFGGIALGVLWTWLVG